VLAAVPKDDPWGFLMRVEVQIVTDADWEALDRILNSFEVVGMLPAPGGGGSYAQVTDDYNSIIVEIPAAWTDINGSPWVDQGDVLGASIMAAPDLNGLVTTWSTPGMAFRVSDDLTKLGGYIQFLDELRGTYLGPCELDGRYDYDDGYYRGKYDLFKKCGGAGGSQVMALSAVSKSDQFAYLILVEVQIVTDADWEAVEHILNSFDVIGELP
jgi:serine protease Do